MRDSAAYVVLWLYILNLGIAFGAGLYESRIAVPQWLIQLTLLTLASLVLVWGTPEPARRWWLISVVAALVDRVLTFLYFIPTMIRLMRGDVRPESAAVAKARQWVRLGYLRHAATLIAWLASLQAFALIHRYGGG